jgi:hypothetical protein
MIELKFDNRTAKQRRLGTMRDRVGWRMRRIGLELVISKYRGMTVPTGVTAPVSEVRRGTGSNGEKSGSSAYLRDRRLIGVGRLFHTPDGYETG